MPLYVVALIPALLVFGARQYLPSNWLIIGVMASLICLAAVAAWHQWLFILPFKKFHQVLKSTDLGIRLNHKEFGVFAALAATLTEKRKLYDEQFGLIKQVVGRLTPMATELTNSNSTIKQNSYSQLSHSQQTLSIMEQVKEVGSKIQVDSESISQALHKSKSQVDEGLNQAKSTKDRIDGLVEDMSQAVKDLEQLKSDNERIVNIIDVINAISEQTNLLALNAAIEAARAGEAGRGFAVVADEVRGLAAKTRESTQEVQEVVNIIQAGTDKVVASMDKGQVSTERSVEQVLATVKSLDSIAESIDHIETMADQIFEEVNQQTERTDQTMDSINQMNSLNQSVQEASGASQISGGDLQKLSDKMLAIIHLNSLSKVDVDRDVRDHSTRKKDDDSSNDEVSLF